MIYKSPWYYLPCVSWPFGSGENVQSGFSTWWLWRPAYILVIFDLQVTLILPIESIDLSIQEKKFKTDFQDGGSGGHFGFPIRTILAISDLQVFQIIPTKFQVNWHFGSREEVQNWFSIWPPWQPCWISIRNNFSYFWSISDQITSYQVSSQLAFQFRKKRFSRCSYGGHLGFLISSNLVTFYLQVTPIFPAKFWVNWPFCSGEVQNRFSRWPPWWLSWISDRNDFRYFWSGVCLNTSYQVWWPSLIFSWINFSYFGSTVTPILPSKFQVNWHFSSGKKIFKMQLWWPSWISDLNDLAILICKSPWYFLPRFEWIGLSVHEKFKIDFKDGHYCSYLGFPIKMFLATVLFICKLPWYFLPSFKSTGLSVQGEVKIDFPIFRSCSSEQTHFSFFGRELLSNILVKFDWNWPRDVGVVVF